MEKQSEKFIYESLADDIRNRIEDGTYRPGDRLPSVREMHRQVNHSISTVFKAYVELETSGFIEARPRSGYYVSGLNGKKINPPVFKKKESFPAKVDLASVVHSVHDALCDMSKLPLGGLIISPDLLPFKHFARITKSISGEKMKELMLYSPPEGVTDFRKEIAKRYSGFVSGLSYENVTITNGCMEALAVALQSVVKAGDTIAIENPSFFMVLQLLGSLGVYVVEIPTNPMTGVTAADIQGVVEKHNIKACLLMPNFQNPLGALMPESEKRAIVRYLSKQKIPLIEDDIYSELYYGKNRPQPMKAYDKEGWVITCASFSKTLSPGFRVGWVLSDRRFHNRVLEQKTAISISNSTLDQYVLMEFLKNGGYDRHLRRLRNEVKKQCHLTARAISDYFPEDTRLAVPKGGAFLWVQLPKGKSGSELFREALKNNIAIVPGKICSNTGEHDNYIRISCGFPFDEEIENGIKQLGEMIKAQ